MPPKEHTHRYVRAVGRITRANKDSGFIGYYKCADPSCSHYQRAELILGKKSICNRCGDEFNLPLAVRALTNKPHCKKCTKGKVVFKLLDTADDNGDTSIEDFLDLEIVVDE